MGVAVIIIAIFLNGKAYRGLSKADKNRPRGIMLSRRGGTVHRLFLRICGQIAGWPVCLRRNGEPDPLHSHCFLYHGSDYLYGPLLPLYNEAI